jgi:predicted DNA-binding protein with PD1-like motif
MNTEQIWNLSTGRRFMGRIGSGSDLIAAVERLCEQHAVVTASLQVIGTLSSATFGIYDQSQQVYITERRTNTFELLACSGNVSRQNDRPCVHAQAVLADREGRIVGGRLFSPTTVYAAELVMLEFVGEPLHRVYDEQTGMMLWQTLDSEPVLSADRRASADTFGVINSHHDQGGK